MSDCADMPDVLTILHTEVDDLQRIFTFFDDSIHYQEVKGYPVWRNYDKNAIARDIEQKKQYKLVAGSKIGIVFTVAFTDKVIWRILDNGNSLYLHRIVVNPEFKGQKLFGKILAWAVEQSRQKSLDSIRMDTWANNPGLINYYKSFGFTVIENYTTPDSEELPVHNRNLALTLLEYRIP